MLALQVLQVIKLLMIIPLLMGHAAVELLGGSLLPLITLSQNLQWE